MRRIGIGLVLAVVLAGGAQAADVDSSRALAELLAKPFERDECEIESALDRRSFDELNELPGLPVLDDAGGWSVIARTAGRPFYCFDSIELDGAPWLFEPSPLQAGTSGIPQDLLDAHFGAGKGVNRFWFVHPASNGHPIVVVLTADGFLNLAGASAPRLFGAVTRMGLIGEPFAARDYAQHVRGVRIDRMPSGALRVGLEILSEAGESSIELDLDWDAANESPVVAARARILPRIAARLGFVGMNFMRGPTLHGVDAFHDGRTLFVQSPDGSVLRSSLVAPLRVAAPAYENLVPAAAAGTRLVLDQPQDEPGYFTRHPGVPYDARADLVLELEAAPQPVTIRKAQVAVDLDDVNPEANETVNVFFALDAKPHEPIEVAWRAEVAAQDFESQLGMPPAGIVYVSSAPGQASRLAFVPLDDEDWNGRPIALTDAVVSEPRSPRVSADGRWIAFEAAPRAGGPEHVHLLDRLRSAVRSVIDAESAPAAIEAALATPGIASESPDGDRLALATPDGVVVTSRAGEPRHVLAGASSPLWVAADRLVVLREQDGETDLHLFDVDRGALRRLTPRDGRSASQPSYAPAVASPAGPSLDAHTVAQPVEDPAAAAPADVPVEPSADPAT